MSLRHGLLGLLNYCDMTGYELAKAFGDSLSYFWQAQTSQIYRELNKMEAQGLLRSRIEVQADRPNKRIYSITGAGKAELHAWLKTEMPDEMLPTRSEALLRIFFSAERTADETIGALKHIAAAYRNQLLRLGDIAEIIEMYKAFAHSENDALYWDFTADFGRAYSEMCMEWAERCVRRLEETKL